MRSAILLGTAGCISLTSGFFVYAKEPSQTKHRVWMTGSKYGIPNGSLVDLDRPTPIPWFSESSSEWKDITIGPTFGAALAPDRLYMWAYVEDRHIPPRSIGDARFGKSIQKIESSEDSIFALTKDGRVMRIDPIDGCISEVQLVTSEKSFWNRLMGSGKPTFTSISVGRQHVIALDKNGNVWTAGSNRLGQCGRSFTRDEMKNKHITSSPEDDNILSSPVVYEFACIYNSTSDGLEKVTCVSAGGNHSMFRTFSGSIFSFGDDSKIQLGLGDTRSQETPDYVPHSGMSMMGPDANNTRLFGSTSPSVKYNFYEKHCRNVPTKMKIPEKFSGSFLTPIGGNDFTILKSGESGMMMCCGENRFGQCGRGLNKQQQTFSPIKLPKNLKPTQISCGTSHCIASLQDGSIYAWGQNNHGQLGTGSRAPACPPVVIHRSKIRGPLTEDIITKIGRECSTSEIEKFLAEKFSDSITPENLLDRKKMIPIPSPDASTSDGTELKSRLIEAIDQSREIHIMSEDEQKRWEPVYVNARFDNSVIIMKNIS
jgi:alpha-tubulin suppressor-like RCC1 family protein